MIGGGATHSNRCSSARSRSPRTRRVVSELDLYGAEPGPFRHNNISSMCGRKDASKDLEPQQASAKSSPPVFSRLNRSLARSSSSQGEAIAAVHVQKAIIDDSAAAGRMAASPGPRRGRPSTGQHQVSHGLGRVASRLHARSRNLEETAFDFFGLAVAAKHLDFGESGLWWLQAGPGDHIAGQVKAARPRPSLN